jgi:hypothetical protein
MQNAQYGGAWLGVSARAIKATISRKKTNSNERGWGMQIM